MTPVPPAPPRPAGLADLADLAEEVRAASRVVAVGAGTHAAVGGAVPADCTPVRAPAGVLAHEPADLTVTLGAGTPVTVLSAALAAAGQEVPLDPRDPRATVGGVLACGRSGHRRLRFGPVRDLVLEVRAVTGDGRIVKGGGPTVKNVSGYDLPRLFVGSLGTLAVLGTVTLRCSPRPSTAAWFRSRARDADGVAGVRARLYRPSALLWDGRHVDVLLEGTTEELAAVAGAAGLDAATGPSWPDGPHRGRISVAPGALGPLGGELDALPVHWLAELGVGTVHVAAERPEALAAARAAAERRGGWLLREAGAPTLDPFGCELPNRALMRRLKEAFDPVGKLAPGRLPL